MQLVQPSMPSAFEHILRVVCVCALALLSLALLFDQLVESTGCHLLDLGVLLQVARTWRWPLNGAASLYVANLAQLGRDLNQ